MKALAVRVVVSGLFLYSGVTKLLDLQDFAAAVAGYDLLSENGVVVTALFVPWIEVWCALALWIAKPFRTSAYLAILGMLLVFTVVKITGVIRGLDISCGCTGSDSPLTWWSVGENMIWLFLAGAGLIWDRRRI